MIENWSFAGTCSIFTAFCANDETEVRSRKTRREEILIALVFKIDLVNPTA
jgi:hypothetical protein